MVQKIVLVPETNASKYFSHREAWGRIKRAIAHGFYLEAVTLEESVISDRLLTYFRKTGVLDPQSKKFISLGKLIELLMKHEPEPIRDPIRNPRFENLQESLDKWRKERNHVVHGIVKTAGEAHDDVLDFFQAAEKIALEGELIAESVNNWYRRWKDREKTRAAKAERANPSNSD